MSNGAKWCDWRLVWRWKGCCIICEGKWLMARSGIYGLKRECQSVLRRAISKQKFLLKRPHQTESDSLHEALSWIIHDQRSYFIGNTPKQTQLHWYWCHADYWALMTVRRCLPYTPWDVYHITYGPVSVYHADYSRLTTGSDVPINRQHGRPTPLRMSR